MRKHLKSSVKKTQAASAVKAGGWNQQKNSPATCGWEETWKKAKYGQAPSAAVFKSQHIMIKWVAPLSMVWELELDDLFDPFQLKVFYDFMIRPHILHPPVLLLGMMSQYTAAKHQVALFYAKVTVGKVDTFKDKERVRNQTLILSSVPSLLRLVIKGYTFSMKWPLG